MKTERSRKIVAGTVLIVLGVLAFLVQQMDGFRESIPLLLAGAVFVILYFTKKKSGFLIPGCILLGLSVGEVVGNNVNWLGDMSSIGLGLGFIAIYVITFIFEEKSHWWPLIPGGFLVLSGISEGNVIPKSEISGPEFTP